MANKVISIKMDEKDIVRLKKYHEVLTRLGIISEKTLTLNGLYKHLLLDYIEEDIRNMLESCASYGLSPLYANPESLENNKLNLCNTYDLREEDFVAYKECAKESIRNSYMDAKSNVELLNTVAKEEIAELEEGIFCSIRALPIELFEERVENEENFWVEKAVETRERYEEAIQRDGIAYDYRMISESSIPEKTKRNLLSAIDRFEKARKNNMDILNGRGNGCYLQ